MMDEAWSYAARCEAEARERTERAEEASGRAREERDPARRDRASLEEERAEALTARDELAQDTRDRGRTVHALSAPDPLANSNF